jgi:putative PIN family toxin of toxin-antitoxin system
MGKKIMRVVFDTNTLISALLFNGHASFLVQLWQNHEITVLASTDTANEFLRVLTYPKFNLSRLRIELIANAYLPYVLLMDIDKSQLPDDLPQCRDVKDQPFIDLAYLGKADVLISGDSDLLVLNGQLPFAIETPAIFKQRSQ